MRRHRQLVLALIVSVLSLGLGPFLVSGCGGGSPSSGGSPTVMIGATPGTIDPGEAVTLTASTTNDSGAGVSWALSGPCTGTACGALSGTTTTSATYTGPATLTSALTVAITATSLKSSSVTATQTITVASNPAITTGAGALPAATLGAAYSTSLAGTGGMAPYQWKVASGSLPAGLTLSSAGGINGTPTAAGLSTFTISLTDSGVPTPITVSAQFSITVGVSPMAITTTALPNAVVGAPYTQTLAATGGTKTGYTWSVTAGQSQLSAIGLSLSASGVLSGTPISAGSATLGVKVTDSGGNSATANLSLTATASLTVVTGTLSSVVAGESYSQLLTAAGGSGTGYTWSVSSGTLPAGLALSTGGGLTGMPTTAGSYSFTAQVKDSVNDVATQSYSGTVAPQLQINTVALTPASANVGYSAALSASGGSGAYQWRVVSGSLPGGMNLSLAGQLAGTPLSSSFSNFHVQLKDSFGTTVTASYGLIVNSGPQPACGHDGTGNSALNGNYAMLLTGYDPNGLSYGIVGVFTADGAGHITSGLGDANGLSFVSSNGSAIQTEQQYTFSGTYAIGPNYGGQATLANTNAGGAGLPPTARFCFAADSVSSGVAQSGRIVEVDGTGFVLTGSFQLRSGTMSTASLTGGYVFGLQGVSSGHIPSDRQAAVGLMNLSGTGTMTGGQIDFAQYSDSAAATQYNAKVPLLTTAANSAVGYSMGANGRGMVTLIANNGTETGQISFVAYATGTGNGLYLLSTDASNTLLAGQAVQQSTSTFTAASVSGASVYRQVRTTDPNVAPVFDRLRIGRYSFDGAGNLTELRDEDAGGTLSLQVSKSGTYAVTSAGYLTMTGNDSNPPSFYLLAPGSGLGLDASSGIGLSLMLAQTAPSGGFSASTLANNNFTIGTVWPAAYSINPTHNYPQDISGTIDFSTGGVLTGILDTVQAPGSFADMGLSSNLSGLTYAVDSNGRLTVSSGGTTTVVGYLVSGTRGFVMEFQSVAGWDATMLDLVHQ